MDLSAVTKETFAPHEGSVFRLQGVDLVLIEVRGGKPRAARPGVRTEPFALLFRGPAATPIPQGTYALEHAALHGLELFLVPVGQDAHGRHYEAVFN